MRARPSTGPERGGPWIGGASILRLAFLLLALSAQVFAASEVATQSESVQPGDKSPASVTVAASRAESFSASRYRPKNLLLKIDFETETVKPVRGQEHMFASLKAETPTGSTRFLYIMYEAGSERERHARIVANPENSAEHVFRFWMRNARAGMQGAARGRIQLSLDDIELESVFQRYRLYLHPDLEFYRAYPRPNGWFTINELWMGPQWEKHPFPFKLGVNILKPAGVNKPLYFVAAADTAPAGVASFLWKEVWTEVGTGFEVPVGEWLDIEVGYKMGDRQNGRFYMAAKRAGDRAFTTVFDITNWTYHPQSPAPVAMTVWQPLKLYTSGAVIDFVRRRGGVTQLYYDDLEIYTEW